MLSPMGAVKPPQCDRIGRSLLCCKAKSPVPGYKGRCMDLSKRLQLERGYHESEDELRNANPLVASVYDSNVFEEADLYQLDALGDIEGTVVLDYGCGGGATLIKLRLLGARAVGFDISRTRLEEACNRLNVHEMNPGDSLVQCSAEQLPFAASSFDRVSGQQILHHLDLTMAMPEIVRVLRPRGRAVFLEPLIHNPILQGYRRLTPHLRSPTEKALSMADLEGMATRFRSWEHKEFCLLAVLPYLVEGRLGKRPVLTRIQSWLRIVDRKLIDLVPSIGRFCWVTVVTLEL